MRECGGIADTFLSLGNHDWMFPDACRDLVSSTGARILDNGYLRHGNLVIGGLTSALVSDYREYAAIWSAKHRTDEGEQLCNYPSWFMEDSETAVPSDGSFVYRLSGIPEYAWLHEFENETGYKILLSHHPEYWKLTEPFLYARNIDLVLAGHAHGGQVRLLGHGIYAPGQGIFPKYTSGIHIGKQGMIVISRGIANTSRVPRLWNPPEIVCLNLL